MCIKNKNGTFEMRCIQFEWEKGGKSKYTYFARASQLYMHTFVNVNECSQVLQHTVRYTQIVDGT